MLIRLEITEFHVHCFEEKLPLKIIKIEYLVKWMCLSVKHTARARASQRWRWVPTRPCAPCDGDFSLCVRGRCSALHPISAWGISRRGRVRVTCRTRVLSSPGEMPFARPLKYQVAVEKDLHLELGQVYLQAIARLKRIQTSVFFSFDLSQSGTWCHFYRQSVRYTLNLEANNKGKIERHNMYGRTGISQ